MKRNGPLEIGPRAVDGGLFVVVQIKMHGDHDLRLVLMTRFGKRLGVEIVFRLYVGESYASARTECPSSVGPSAPALIKVSSLEAASQVGGIGFCSGCM